jgi:protein SCO1/2
MRLVLILTLLTTLAGSAAHAMPGVTSLPPDSLYQSTAKLTDDHGRRMALTVKRGQPQIVSMFYTSCKFVCPMIIDGALAIEESLNPAERARLGVMLISFDPKRDTPQALSRMRHERDLDEARWTLLRPDPPDVRGIASLLGIRYRALADGEFNHTTALVLLDAEGRIVARTERVAGPPDPAFLAAVRKALAAPD